MATFKTFDAVGNKEDLSDVITNISPVDTQFFSSLSEAGCDATTHEWTTDSLAAAGSNKHLEGDDTADEDCDPTVRLSNYTQIQKKVYKVSNTQDSVSKAGKSGKELDYQTAKKMKELSKDIEYAFLMGVKAQAGASTEGEMRGALNWMTTNTVLAGSGASQNATTGVVTTGTRGDLTSTLMKEASQNVFTAGGNPSIAYCNAFQKTQISTFAQDSNSNYRVSVEEKKLTDTVDVYVNDFFTLAVKPHRIMPTDKVFICDADYWKKATLRPTFSEELAKTGDNTKMHVVVEHTLEACAENSSALIANLTTS